MAFYKLTTNNPNFSFVIEKNPATGLQIKRNKKGVFFFWYSSDANENDTFNIHFKDASDEMSYPQNKYAQFEYLNASKYNDARCLLDVCQELLHAAREKDKEQDSKEYEYKFYINCLETQFKTIDIFEKYFTEKGFKFQYSELIQDNYQIIITTTNRSLRELICLVNLFALFATLNSPDYYYIDEEIVVKYLKLANYLDVPYFIKYLIKIRMIRNAQKFPQFKEALDQSFSFNFDFQYGDTHDMRIDFIKKKIDCNNFIIDIGAGVDYKYLRVFSKKMQENNQKYFAIDMDEEARYKISKGIENKGLDNVVVHQSLTEVIEEFKMSYNGNSPKVDILCTEVLEHNEMTEAEEIVINMLENFNINQLIITVPNVDFNKHYAISRLRHEDHKWEIPFEEFKSFITTCLNKSSKKYKAEFTQIGDLVDGIQVTSCAVLTEN